MIRVRNGNAVAAGAALLFLLPGCSGSDGGGPSSSHTLAVQSGNGASAPVTQAVVLTVRVTDDSGAMESGVSISWSVTSGGGSITPKSTSDGSGLASATFTLGQAAGPQTARASAGGTPVTFTVTAVAGPATKLIKSTGDGQFGNVGTALAQPYAAEVEDQYNNPVSGVKVAWSVSQGGGSLSADTSVSAASGAATVVHTMGPAAGVQSATATAAGLTGSPLTFTATARSAFVVLGGGNNVPERYTSDLWVHGAYAYTGTWGFRAADGNSLKIWHLDAAGVPTLVDSVITPGIGTVSDVEVSSDGSLLIFGGERGGAPNNGNGVYLYSLADPAHPAFIAKYLVSTGIHTATFGYIGGKQYVFAAKDPSSPALMVFEIAPAAATPITLVSLVPVPANYGHHDTFVRDGIAFVCAWNTGVMIYDVGDGVLGGSPASPQLISSLVTPGGEVHNAWWFHNPVTGEKKYLFIGQEGPGAVGSASSGDIHVVDVSSLATPHEVASYGMAAAGTHNFWMDESRQVLYAAYYNGGVVALDVSGTLSGNLASREIARMAPGGAGNTYVWGVMLANGHLYASDMLSGLWELNTP